MHTSYELESYDEDYFGAPLAKYGLAFAYLDRNKDRACSFYLCSICSGCSCDMNSEERTCRPLDLNITQNDPHSHFKITHTVKWCMRSQGIKPSKRSCLNIVTHLQLSSLLSIMPLRIHAAQKLKLV